MREIVFCLSPRTVPKAHIKHFLGWGEGPRQILLLGNGVLMTLVLLIANLVLKYMGHVMLKSAIPPFWILITILVMPMCRLVASTSCSFGLRGLDKYLINLCEEYSIRGILKRNTYF